MSGENLPATPLPDDVIDRVAREVAAQVSDHIEFMYPDAAAAVAWADYVTGGRGTWCASSAPFDAAGLCKLSFATLQSRAT